MDVSLEDGIPKGFRTMDVGPQTAAALKVGEHIRQHGPTVLDPLETDTATRV